MKVNPIMKLKINKAPFVFFILTFVISISNAQNNRIKLNGLVKYDSIKLQDINIKNKATNFGTSSNKNGHFTIYAKKGDSILFSSVVYEDRIIKISDTHINAKKMIIYLEPDYYQLDEVMLNKQISIDWSNASVTPGTVFNADEISSKKPPDARKFTDPNANAGGLNPTALFMQLTKKARLKRKKRKLEAHKNQLLKQEFSTTIRNLYGNDFYIKSLTIPEEKINIFLDYCQANGLNEYYLSDEFIIKDFLIKQAIKFNTLSN
ncbi:carboxypeptidase-like regulatory domain-containing protein [Lutibacter sp.]|uniref:carboxypeptidase-like regulatory domain-containing protein n=1 Tax=Lutibacter sp. TaxID=1925666 RepID=UPI0025C4E82B|nr:carboxypeptidase-like regulatory domain-containing protein [Lutibacter sp.]MCF6181980.1 carboxypeptidase-like regulatory domain-containing protein [Lutibacter sp.]